MPGITLDQQKKIYDLGQRSPVLSTREIARILKLSRDSVEKFRGPLPTSEEDILDEVGVEAQLKVQKSLERLRLENNRLRQVNRILTRDTSMTAGNVFEEFEEWLANEAPDPFTHVTKTYKAPKTSGSVFDKNHEEIAALVLSDWHTAETIRMDETNGLNSFNSMVLSNRAWQIIDKFKRIVRGHQSMYAVKKIWLALLGDFVHGSIHVENILTNDLLDVPSAMLVARLLVMAIDELKTLGIPIEADCIVGNHPRIGLANMPTKRQAETSYDWIIYKMLEQRYQDDKQVDIRIHLGQFGIVDLAGHRVVVEHGYKASGDIDMVAKIRAMYDSPVYRNSSGMTGSSVEYIVIGDRHRAQTGEGYMVNGCLSGSNELGVAWRLSPIGAIQQMFGISKSKIPTWTYPLDVCSETSEEAKNPFSEYTQRFMEKHGR